MVSKVLIISLIVAVPIIIGIGAFLIYWFIIRRGSSTNGNLILPEETLIPEDAFYRIFFKGTRIALNPNVSLYNVPRCFLDYSRSSIVVISNNFKGRPLPQDQLIIKNTSKVLVLMYDIATNTIYWRDEEAQDVKPELIIKVVPRKPPTTFSLQIEDANGNMRSITPKFNTEQNCWLPSLQALDDFRFKDREAEGEWSAGRV